MNKSIKEKIETIKAWRDTNQAAADDKRQGVGLMTSHVDGKMRADCYSNVLKLFKEDV